MAGTISMFNSILYKRRTFRPIVLRAMVYKHDSYTLLEYQVANSNYPTGS